MTSNQIRVNSNDDELQSFISNLESFCQLLELKNIEPTFLTIPQIQVQNLLEEAKKLQGKLKQSYVIDIEPHMSRPGSIVVYNEIIDHFLQATGPNKLIEIAHEAISPLALSDSDITLETHPKFLFLEKGKDFLIDNRTTAVCRNVLTKEQIVNAIIEPDPTKETENISADDRVIIETKEGYRYLVAYKSSDIIGSPIGKETNYNNTKVKVIGSITESVFETRILS